MFLLLTMTIILLGACSNNKEVTSETTDIPDFFDIQMNTKTNLDSMGGIEFSHDLDYLELSYPGGKPVQLTNDSFSTPLKSPNGKKAVYISPWGWEEWNELYIVDLQNGYQETLVPYDVEGEIKPKDVIWEDDEHILVILGRTYGTVDLGGGVYRINVETYKSEEIPIPDQNNQITEFLRIEDGVLYYNGIQFSDEGQIRPEEEYSSQIRLKTE